MTAEALDFTFSFFHTIWYLFIGWKLPGTNVTPAAWALFLVLVVVFVKTVKRLLVIPDSSAGSSPSGGSHLPDIRR